MWRAFVSDLTPFFFLWTRKMFPVWADWPGSPKSRGGRVALPTSGSVEADSPHLHQTAALFWHGSKSWPGGHWCLGVGRNINAGLCLNVDSFFYRFICFFYLLLPSEVHVWNGMPGHTWRKRGSFGVHLCLCFPSCQFVIEQSSSLVPWQGH